MLVLPSSARPAPVMEEQFHQLQLTLDRDATENKAYELAYWLIYLLLGGDDVELVPNNITPNGRTVSITFNHDFSQEEVTSVAEYVSASQYEEDQEGPYIQTIHYDGVLYGL